MISLGLVGKGQVPVIKVILQMSVDSNRRIFGFAELWFDFLHGALIRRNPSAFTAAACLADVLSQNKTKNREKVSRKK